MEYVIKNIIWVSPNIGGIAEMVEIGKMMINHWICWDKLTMWF